MTTTSLAPSTPTAVRRSVLEHASVREILMGAQDNLTNVLAVMLGVSIGRISGTVLLRDGVRLVLVAGVAASAAAVAGSLLAVG